MQNSWRGKTVARSFTQYWKNTTWDTQEASGEALDHTASNEFRRRGVEPGDRIFIVTNIDGTLYLGGVVVVDRIVGQRDAERRLGSNLWEAKDHVIGRGAQPFNKALRVPLKTVKALR